mmetsp:Transcript_4754/g.11991  ORF Transcript_4754/g.11991 Transcript_4754/m.11991 type:complete len:204 (+) Transcript_4754:328-939(+)
MAVSTTSCLTRSSVAVSSNVVVLMQKSKHAHSLPSLSVSTCGCPSVCGTLHCSPPLTRTLVASSHFSVWQMLMNTLSPVSVSLVLAANPLLGTTSCTPLPYTCSALPSLSSCRRYMSDSALFFGSLISCAYSMNIFLNSGSLNAVSNLDTSSVLRSSCSNELRAFSMRSGSPAIAAAGVWIGVVVCVCCVYGTDRSSCLGDTI